MHATAHGGARTHVRESALKVDSERNISCRTGESNLRKPRAGPTLYQLSYTIPAPIISFIYPDRFSITTEYQKGLYKRSGANNKTVQVLERLCVLSVISEAVLTTKQSKCLNASASVCYKRSGANNKTVQVFECLCVCLP